MEKFQKNVSLQADKINQKERTFTFLRLLFNLSLQIPLKLFQKTKRFSNKSCMMITDDNFEHMLDRGDIISGENKQPLR